MIAALDIGGANIKAAHSGGATHTRPFAVWREPGRLHAAIADALRELPPFDTLAVTMTAELCDCFATKRDGVLAVLDAVERARDEIDAETAIRIWRLDGRLGSLAEARKEPLRAAAANWLALATFAAGGLAATGPALLADMGSTTVDLVPIRDGAPCPRGFTDTERLLAGELVYTGMRRTPVATMVDALPYRGRSCPVMAERFATSQDAHVILGALAEDASDTDTADGRSLTVLHSSARLARMIGADGERFTLDDARAAARAVVEAQRARIAAAASGLVARLGAAPATVVLSGEGEDLAGGVAAELWPSSRFVSLGAELGVEASRAACAHALVALAQSSLTSDG